jgi:hypothetical protein
VTFTAVAVAFMLACIVLGARGGARVARPIVAALLAVVMVVAQFALLASR